MYKLLLLQLLRNHKKVNICKSLFYSIKYKGIILAGKASIDGMGGG